MPEHPFHVVIAGGGVAALEGLMALRDHAGDRVRITLLAPEDDFRLKALATAEPFSVDHARPHALAAIAEGFGAELRSDEVILVEAGAHTVVCRSGAEIEYDALLLAPGARARPAYAQALTFGLERTPNALNGVIVDLEQGYTKSVAFIVPPGVSWPLPVYELALMTARNTWSMGIEDARLMVLTPEAAPLAIFGPQASAAVRGLLDAARVEFVPNAYAAVEAGGTITLVPGDRRIHADRVVALPLLEGPRMAGVPGDASGFIPVDEHARVVGLDDVYAAGDATSFAVKQGGIACQQADAAAEHLALRAGADIEPRPFRPVLRGKLLTGSGAQYLRTDLRGGAGESRTSDVQLWFPPAKVSGHYLSHWLATAEGRETSATREPALEHVEVEVALRADLQTGDDPMALEPLGRIPALYG